MTLDLTANGRLNVHPFVSERKMLAMTEMAQAAKLGGYAGERARLDLKESLSTSDAPFSFAHLVNLTNLPQYIEQVPAFDSIVQTETVPDFNPIQFFNLTFYYDSLANGKDTDGQLIAPEVSELDTYQYAFGYTQENALLQVQKRGFKLGLSLEKAVNDVYGMIQRFPNDMLRVGQKTQEYVVHRAIVNGTTSASQLQAGTDLITGATVAANAKLRPESLRTALIQVGLRRNSRGFPIPVPASYSLVVPLGQGIAINWALGVARGLYEVEDGQITYQPANGSAADPINRITNVIEDEWLTGNAWYLIPNKGTTLKPALVQVELAGYTTPEVYVSNFNGAPYAGAASSDPFTAFSFDNDAIDFKFRQFTNAAVMYEDQIVWSTGAGA